MTDRHSLPAGWVAASVLVFALAAASGARALGAERAEPLARCHAMVKSAPDDYRSYNCFWAVGRDQGVLDQAAQSLRSLLAERPDSPHPQAYLAAVEMDRGNSEVAATLFRWAADGHARAGNATAEAHVRLTLTFHLTVNMSRLDEAEGEIAKVRGLMGSVSDPSLPGWLAMRETALANNRLEFGRALRILRGIEPEFFPRGPWTLRQLWLDNMGFTLRALGQLGAAARAYRAEAELLRSVGQSYEEAIPLRNLALLAIRRGDSEVTCRGLAEAALQAARDTWMLCGPPYA